MGVNSSRMAWSLFNMTKGVEVAEGSVQEEVFERDFHADGSRVDWSRWFVVDAIVGKALFLDCVELLPAFLA